MIRPDFDIVLVQLENGKTLSAWRWYQPDPDMFARTSGQNICGGGALQKNGQTVLCCSRKSVFNHGHRKLLRFLVMNFSKVHGLSRLQTPGRWRGDRGLDGQERDQREEYFVRAHHREYPRNCWRSAHLSASHHKIRSCDYERFMRASSSSPKGPKPCGRPCLGSWEPAVCSNGRRTAEDQSVARANIFTEDHGESSSGNKTGSPGSSVKKGHFTVPYSARC